MRAETWLQLESIHMTALAAFDGALERSAQIIESAENKNPTPLILADKGAGFPSEKEDSDGND